MKTKKIEKQKRIEKVQDLILKDKTTGDIVNYCMKMWAISDRQAKRYIVSANEGFAKVTEKRLEYRLSYHIQRRQKLLRDLEAKTKNTPSGITAQLNVLQDIAKLEKLYTLKIEHSGKDGAAIQTDSTHRVIFEDYAE